MIDFDRIALLLEEKAGKLPRADSQRASLLAIAKAARLIDIEQHADDFEIEHGIGSFRKRACVWASMAEQMPEGPERDELEYRAIRAAIHGALEGLEMPRT